MSTRQLLCSLAIVLRVLQNDTVGEKDFFFILFFSCLFLSLQLLGCLLDIATVRVDGHDKVCHRAILIQIIYLTLQNKF